MSWTHIRLLMFMEDTLERKFYMEMCRIEHWDTRTLEEKIDGQLYQRTAISARPEEVIKRELVELRNNDSLNTSCWMMTATYAWHNTTQNCHQKKFWLTACKGQLPLPVSILPSKNNPPALLGE